MPSSHRTLRAHALLALSVASMCALLPAAYAAQCQSVDASCPNIVFMGSTTPGTCPEGQKRVKDGCVAVTQLTTACSTYNSDSVKYTPLGQSGKCLPSCPSGYSRRGTTGKGGMQVRCIKCQTGYTAVSIPHPSSSNVTAAGTGNGSNNGINKGIATTTGGNKGSGSTGSNKGSGNKPAIIRCKANNGGSTLKQPVNRVYLDLKYAPAAGTVTCPSGQIAVKGDCVSCSSSVQASYNSGYGVASAGDLRLCVPVGDNTEASPNCCVGYKSEEEMGDRDSEAPAPAPEDEGEGSAPAPAPEDEGEISAPAPAPEE